MSWRLTKAVASALAKFLGAREGARRFHAQDIGQVDPNWCFADFLTRVQKRDTVGIEKVYGPECVKTAMASTSGATGGYLVPTAIGEDLMFEVAEKSLVRPRATCVDMPTQEYKLPFTNVITAQSAGTSPLAGGLNFQWTSEGKARSETEPTWAQIDLKAWELSGSATVSNTLMQDGGKGLEKWLRLLFAEAIAWSEDFAFLQGNGVGKPMGMVNAGGTKVINRQTPTSFTIADVGNMVKGLLPSSWARDPIWAVSPTVWTQIVAIGGASNFQINQPPEGGKAKGVIAGLEMYVTERLPALGTLGDVLLFDGALYVVGDRSEIIIDVSKEEPTAFPKYQSVWLVMKRVDGKPAVESTITLQDSTSSVSPYVVLN